MKQKAGSVTLPTHTNLEIRTFAMQRYKAHKRPFIGVAAIWMLFEAGRAVCDSLILRRMPLGMLRWALTVFEGGLFSALCFPFVFYFYCAYVTGETRPLESFRQNTGRRQLFGALKWGAVSLVYNLVTSMGNLPEALGARADDPLAALLRIAASLFGFIYLFKTVLVQYALVEGHEKSFWAILRLSLQKTRNMFGRYFSMMLAVMWLPMLLSVPLLIVDMTVPAVKGIYQFGFPLVLLFFRPWIAMSSGGLGYELLHRPESTVKTRSSKDGLLNQEAL